MIERASGDPRYQGHPGLALYGIESYIAVPLFRAGGAFFGTLCALDPEAADLPEEKLEIFRLLAELIAAQLDQEDLQREREHFIAALGHDLRSPLSAVVTSTAMLQSVDLPQAARPAVSRIERSTHRMQGLVDDLLDLARGRLGDGMSLNRQPVDLGEMLHRVVDEASPLGSTREIGVEVTGDSVVSGDPSRLGQLISNLVVNALDHGGDRPVKLLVEGGDDVVTLTVVNWGEPIPPELVPRLFHPFRRGRPGADGLGLGLYIASQVAQAHGGTIDVASDPVQGTRFTVRLPRAAPAA